MVAALVSTAALGGCGSSSQTLSAHDHSAVKQFGVLVRQYQSLEKAIGADTIAGSGIHSRERYIVQDGPRIDQLSKTADSIRQVVASIQNLTLAKLEDPFSEALYAEATDLVRFLNILRQPNTPNRRSVINSQLQTSYAKIGDDEQRIKQRGTRATAQGGSLRQKPLWLEHRGDAGGLAGDWRNPDVAIALASSTLDEPYEQSSGLECRDRRTRSRDGAVTSVERA